MLPEGLLGLCVVRKRRDKVITAFWGVRVKRIFLRRQFPVPVFQLPQRLSSTTARLTAEGETQPVREKMR
jgi:hypothetical protein